MLPAHARCQLQIALMREGLRDKVIQGQPWRLGSKKREELIRDYRWVGGWVGKCYIVGYG